MREQAHLQLTISGDFIVSPVFTSDGFFIGNVIMNPEHPPFLEENEVSPVLSFVHRKQLTLKELLK